MNNPLKIGIMKTRIPNNPDKLRSLSVYLNKFIYPNSKKKVSKDRNYLLDGKIKLHNTGVVVEHKKERVEGIVQSLEIPIKYTKSGVIGLDDNKDPVYYKSIFVNLVLSKARADALKNTIKKINKYRKAADKDYFNSFHNCRITIDFHIIEKDKYNLVKRLVVNGPIKDLYLEMDFKD